MLFKAFFYSNLKVNSNTGCKIRSELNFIFSTKRNGKVRIEAKPIDILRFKILLKFQKSFLNDIVRVKSSVFFYKATPIEGAFHLKGLVELTIVKVKN